MLMDTRILFTASQATRSISSRFYKYKTFRRSATTSAELLLLLQSILFLRVHRLSFRLLITMAVIVNKKTKCYISQYVAWPRSKAIRKQVNRGFPSHFIVCWGWGGVVVMIIVFWIKKNIWTSFETYLHVLVKWQQRLDRYYTIGIQIIRYTYESRSIFHTGYWPHYAVLP